MTSLVLPTIITDHHALRKPVDRACLEFFQQPVEVFAFGDHVSAFAEVDHMLAERDYLAELSVRSLVASHRVHSNKTVGVRLERFSLLRV